MARVFLDLTDLVMSAEGSDKFGFERLLAEVDKDGLTSRELALGENNKIMHRYTENDRGSYALFSACTFDAKEWSGCEVSLEEFERLWKLSSSSDPSLG
jgi:hypothetical protein